MSTQTLETPVVTTKFPLLVAVKRIGGTSFVGVRGYTSEVGEKSNYTFVIGSGYEKILTDDLKALQNFNIETLVGKDFSFLELAAQYAKMVISLQKRTSSDEIKAELLENGDLTMIRSQAQKDAYIALSNGIKTKFEDGVYNLYVYGLLFRKTVVEAAPIEKAYKPLTHHAKMVKAIEKAAGLRGAKWRQFKLGNKESVKLSGVTFQIA